MGQFKTLFLAVFSSPGCGQLIDGVSNRGGRLLELESDLKPSGLTRMKVANDGLDLNRLSLQVDLCLMDGVKHRADVRVNEEPALAGVHNDAAMREFQDAP